MKYKPFGNTGKMVSAIGFGGMRFRIEDHIDGNFDKCAELVLRACEMGINYFDTAPEYCEDHSELIMGHAFKQLKAKPYISTKVNLRFAHDASSARRMIEQSLKRLNVDKITFYQMWCIKNLDEYKEFIKSGGIYDGMLKAKDEGLVEHICCSAHADSDEITEIISDGRVEAVTIGYNALNFAYRRKAVCAAHKKGLGVVTMNPLGGGMIPRHPELFDFLPGEASEPIVSKALKFLIGQPEISTAIVGMFNMRQLEENVRIASQDISEITEENMSNMRETQSASNNSLCTLCSYCDKCPQGIPVPKLMDAYNELVVTGEMRFVSRRLKEYWHMSSEDAVRCVECGKCEELCTQHLQIIERLKMVAKA